MDAPMLPVQQMLERYFDRYGDERTALRQLIEFVRTTPPADLFRRDNFVGHLTASAFVVDPVARRVLLHRHKSFGRYLQPGGHIDPGETPLQAALRETEEEVGLSPATLRLISHDPAAALPFDLDSHAIPASARKQEPAHVHHDVRFLFVYTPTPGAPTGPRETDDVAWLAPSEFAHEADFVRVAAKIEAFFKTLD